MAYVKTEKVLAEIEGRKARIVKAALTIISKHGIAELTSAKVAKVSRLSVGLIYKHFPDMDELRAHVLGQKLATHLAMLRAPNIHPLADGVRMWACDLADDVRLADALAVDANYREGIRRELTKRLASVGVSGPKLMAAVVLGAVLEAARSSTVGAGGVLTTTLLRACGLRLKENA